MHAVRVVVLAIQLREPAYTEGLNSAAASRGERTPRPKDLPRSGSASACCPMAWALGCRDRRRGATGAPEFECQRLAKVDWSTLWPGQLQRLVRPQNGGAPKESCACRVEAGYLLRRMELRPGRALRLLPICVAGVGVGVHSLGLLGIDPQGASRVAHATMLFLDSSVLVGLLGRRTWGYWLALGLFAQQTVFQTYWAYAAAVRDAQLWQAQLATPLVCLACLIILVARRDWYRVEEPGGRSAV